jgi:hypothetical protein
MKLRVVGLCLPTFLAACGSSSNGPNVTLLLQKPPGTDDSCLGIVGFEVTAQVTGKAPVSETILNAAAVQSVDDCKLARPFTMGDLDIESPITVMVRGYDGADQPRVSGSASIDNLHTTTAINIPLLKEGAPPPPLILDRTTLLGGIPLSEVASMTISTAKGQPIDLKTIARDKNPYFDVDPGGYGIENVGSNQDLSITFAFLSASQTLPKQRVVTRLDAAAPILRAP